MKAFNTVQRSSMTHPRSQTSDLQTHAEVGLELLMAEVSRRKLDRSWKRGIEGLYPCQCVSKVVGKGAERERKQPEATAPQKGGISPDGGACAGHME